MESDAAYFARRANEELLAASRAEHPDARRAHYEMATRYHELAREIRAHEIFLIGGQGQEAEPAALGLAANRGPGIWL